MFSTYFTAIENPVDTYFLIDASNDVPVYDLERIKEFVNQHGRTFGVSGKKRVSVYAYATASRLYLPIKDGDSVERLTSAVNKVTNSGEMRSITNVLKTVKEDIVKDTSGKGIGKLVVIFIAGSVSPLEVFSMKSESENLRKLGAQVVAVGIGTKVNKNDVLSLVQDKADASNVPVVDQLPSVTSLLSDALKNAQKVSEKIDLAFFIGVDSNNAVQDFSLGKQLAIGFLEKLDVSLSKIRIGLVVFGANARVYLRFVGTQDKDQVKRIFEGLATPQPGLGLVKALELGSKEIFNERYGARTDVPKTAFIITNNFNDIRSKDASEALRKQGVRIVATVLGGSNRVTYVSDIATADRGVIKVENDNAIRKAINSMITALLPGMLNSSIWPSYHGSS